ncbi:hypothetical protein F53441_7605 [Fusarium austroafricanum]|uniref:Uncharacterized protein n=1 Tax=Fusarium austroafricanum TaxID=2364996 RepID=A0A8H4KFB2_9HYPO|nr:hypothetical protein F53441_7605 [Fusarium austroafricanum]
MAFYTLDKVMIAHAAMVILTAWLPSIIVFFCSLFVRSRKDPARTGFTYFKFALFLFSGFAFFDVCSYALSIAYNRIHRDSYLESGLTKIDVKSLSVASAVCSLLAGLYTNITDILIMIALLRLSTGVVIAQSGHAGPIGKILRFTSYIAATILLALVLASFGLRIRFIYEYYYNDVDIGVDSLKKMRQILFAFDVLIFVISLGVVARAVMVKKQPAAEKTLVWASNMLIVASVFWLLHTTFNMASLAAWSNLSDPLHDPEYKYAYYILDVVFSIWPQFLVLIMVFFMGLRPYKKNGIWSKQEEKVQGPATPWGYGSNDPQIQGAVPPIAQQQPYVQQQPYPQQPYPQQPQQSMPQGWNPQQQQQAGYYAPQQQQYAPYPAASPVSNPRSPPPHEEALGLNHQADGTPPQMAPQPYSEKHA